MNQKRITNQILFKNDYSLNSTLNYLFNISNMKKLFSYLLISSMVILSSCTNYDDQFDDLNTQINTLKSQIEGFSSLSSGLTALQGTVASLQSAINNIPVTPATDISGLEASLTSLAAEVTALQTSLASAATAAEVAALTTSLAAVQADLADLLAANNVYSEDILVTNASTLTFAKNLGDKLAIVNGNVTFVVTPEMSITDVQEVANKLVTVTKDVSYYATSSTVAGVTFDNLTSAANIEYSQSGDLKMAKLESAGVVSLASSAKVGIVDFRALASVTSINMATFTNHTSGASSSSAADRIAVTTSAAHTLNFSSATEIHLTALPYYTSGLTITGKLGGVVALTAFASVDADGEEAATNLNITGPAAVTMGDTYTLGTFTATNVETVTLGAHRGNVSLTGVTNFTHANLVGTLTVTDSSDLTTVDITGDFDDVTTGSKDKSGPAISLASQTALKTASFAGTVGAINLTGATNLTTLTVGGTVDSVTLSNNNDLTSVTTSGKIGSFSIDGADDLSDLSLAHTTLTRAAVAAAGLSAIKSGSLVVTNNPKLASLTSVADALSKLTVTGNTLLSSIDFTGLKVVGGETTHSVTVSGNALNAEKIVEGDGTTAGATAKVGAFTSASGMSTLKTYLDDAVAETNKVTISVSFDSADTHILKSTTAGTDDTETNNITSGAKLVVMDITATVTTPDTTPTIRETVSYAIDINRTNTATYVADALGSQTVAITAKGQTRTFSNANDEITTVAGLISAIGADTTTWGSDVTITAAEDTYVTSKQTLSYTDASGTATQVVAGGNVVWSFGSVTGTLAAATNDTAALLAAKMATALDANAAYEASASGSTISITKVVTNTAYTNVGPGVSFAGSEKFGFTINASTTASFGGASSTVGLNSDYFLAVSKNDVKGLRVTVKNNSTSVALGTTNVVVTNAGALSTTVTSLVSGANMDANASYAAAFSDISTTGAASVATGNSVDRTSWL